MPEPGNHLPATRHPGRRKICLTLAAYTVTFTLSMTSAWFTYTHDDAEMHATPTAIPPTAALGRQAQAALQAPLKIADPRHTHTNPSTESVH
ncbi:hypothetical protein [Andreprevotia chitinilytica]|uniref:hypothetical protein n=1 Tax=Andreprevotia chitinilytica TaxID=396808 RepID=UPI0012EB9C26|nr:hypothetical protein [Andreprevotia chitinilytica]